MTDDGGQPITEARLDEWGILATEGAALHFTDSLEWIVCDAVKHLVAEVRRLQAAEAVRGDRERALVEALQELLHTLSLGPLEVAAIYGPDADDPVIYAAEKARQALAAHGTASEPPPDIHPDDFGAGDVQSGPNTPGL